MYYVLHSIKKTYIFALSNNNKTQNTEKDEELDSMHGGNNNLC